MAVPKELKDVSFWTVEKKYQADGVTIGMTWLNKKGQCQETKLHVSLCELRWLAVAAHNVHEELEKEVAAFKKDISGG